MGTTSKFIADCIQKRFDVPPIEDNIEAICEWFGSPLGQYYLSSESAVIEKTISNLFGYHLMQISVCGDADFSSASRINHCFNLSPKILKSNPQDPADSIVSNAHANFDALPFSEEEIDVTILHHVLEFSHNPHQVLKEAARVTVPRGYIVICGFNPFSIDGLIHKFGRGFSGRAIWRRHRLNVRRMKDWLKLVDFSCVETHYTCFNFAINNQQYLKKNVVLDRKFGKKNIPVGGSYCIIARKDKVGLTPLKMGKERSPLINALPIPKQAMQVNDRKAGMVVPFRLKTSKNQ